MARFPLNAVVNFRSCGTCAACCEILGIRELGKPPKQKCPNQCEGGKCAVYESRPATCAGYECLWRMGILEGDERRRPDNLGVIFDFRGEREVIRSGADIRWVEATEVWPGAFQQENVQWLIRRIADRLPVRARPY